MKSAARPVINALRRGFAAQAASARADSAALPKQEPKISHLPNGVVIASLENYSPVSKVAIVVNAGSKVEDGDNVGANHCIRNAANLTTSKMSGFAVTRSVQQLGGSYNCSTTRDHMLYQLEVMRDGLDTGFESLATVALDMEFFPWELTDNVKRTELDLALLNQMPEAQMVEALHKAAFRTGLGNSLYMPRHFVGTHSTATLQAFVKQHYTSNNMAVVGVGVDHDQLVKLAKNNLKAASGQAPAVPASVYHGGEIRVATNDALVHAAVVTEGASLGSKDLLTLGVLQHVMGAGPSIKYSANLAASKVGQAASQAATNPFAASCINMNYADAGLFGYHVIAHKKDVGQVLKSVTAAFANATKGGVSDADVKRGKAQLKAALLMGSESSSGYLEDVAAQILLSNQVLQRQDIEASIDKITTADVQTIAKKIFNGKPSMAAVGDLGDTPYLDEIMA